MKGEEEWCEKGKLEEHDEKERTECQSPSRTRQGGEAGEAYGCLFKRQINVLLWTSAVLAFST